MHLPTTIFSRRIPSARLAPLLLAAAISACSSNNSGTGGTPVRLTLITGGAISAVVGSAIGPIVVRVTDIDTIPVQGVLVTFTVNGGATLSVTSVATDAQGQALTSVTLGHTVGVVTVTAAATGVATGVTLQETGIADAPSQLTIAGGNSQSAPKGTQLSDPMTAVVTDQYGNTVSGVTITWTTTSGVLSSASGRTDGAGRAQTQLTLPGATGVSTVTASGLIGGGTATVNFTATAT